MYPTKGEMLIRLNRLYEEYQLTLNELRAVGVDNKERERLSRALFNLHLEVQALENLQKIEGEQDERWMEEHQELS